MKNAKNKKKIMFDEGFASKVAVAALNLAVLGAVFAAQAHAGSLFDNANKLINDIYVKFVGMSTAAAGVGAGVGAFMKKFSMGKQERVEMGNKVIKDSIIAWATLNGIGLILNYISAYTK